MNYCRIITENHIIAISHPNCIEDINTHIAGEGYIGPALFINGETLIDLDAVEAIEAVTENRLRNQSMDMTIGLRNIDLTTQEMLLVDFKFRVVNPNNLSQVDMRGKVMGSSLIMGTSIPIRNEYIFIFQPNLVQQARSRIARMLPSVPTAYVAMDMATLITTYFQ